VVCLAPRAPGDSVRPRRSWDVVVRPLNFTVRRRAGGDVDTLIWTFLLVVPYAILTTAGVLLWRRWRSAATAMIALGFAATLLSLASGLFATYRTHAALSELTSAPRAHQDTFFFVAHYHRFPLLTLGLLGIWAAAVGTLWHVRRDR
jgi:hypothetical protein